MHFAKLFRSRWAALIWAGGILWTAVDVAGYSPSRQPDNQAAGAVPTDATGEVVQNSDLVALAAALNSN
ncbi:hypothetical protein NDN01_01845 [Sphingomonas sp. QA11]|uniref:hypothetical protein n=1 Tax=Sphingomonas sp. QA11 TaxID=2950605 RepID=UPI002349DF86|nr:hypothetical protein [Sphingomonas sp. QA11]WCM27700.1 hypothetical protein NDN01_01845 [Sphingomonas sp. QA11]